MRQIVCFKIPDFQIALARLHEPSLKQRPVAVASPHTARACLQEVSLEARQEGLASGMPVEDAYRLCRSLRLLAPDPFHVHAAQRDLLQVVAPFAPAWEPLRPGQLFLDLSGTARLFGPAVDAAARIEREVVRRRGLAGMAGVASNKLVSRVAVALLEPPQIHDIRPGEEQPFLSPLPVSVLSELNPSDTRKLLPLLEDLNLPTLGAVAAIPLHQLETVFGARATQLHHWAHGIDASPVLPLVRQPHLELVCPVEPDSVDDDRLLGLLYGLVEQLCRQLRARQRVCGRLTLSLLSSDQQETTRHRSVQPPTQWENEMYPDLRQLFLHMFTRRVRLRSLRLRTDSLPLPGEQLTLFDHAGGQTRARRLALALDRVRTRFGSAALRVGRTIGC
jgi:DNA polymerase-4